MRKTQCANIHTHTHPLMFVLLTGTQKSPELFGSDWRAVSKTLSRPSTKRKTVNQLNYVFKKTKKQDVVQSASYNKTMPPYTHAHFAINYFVINNALNNNIQ